MTDESNTKSAGQLLYEKTMDKERGMLEWEHLSPKTQQRHEFNAIAVPKAQTLKLP